jgi:prepilin peptidase CpaA
MTTSQALFLAMYIAILIGAALNDAREFRISNAFPVALLILFVMGAAVGIVPVAHIGSHVAHFGVALIGGMSLYSIGWFGGGDAKLYAATALFVPFGDGWFLLVWIALAGFGLVVVTMIWRVLSAMFTSSTPTRRQGIRKIDRRIAYGIAIAIGGVGAIATSANSVIF